MSDVEDFMNTPMGTVPRPPILPAGTYLGTVHSYKTNMRKRDGTEIPVLTLTIKVAEGKDDVDMDLLSKFDLARTYTSMDYWLDDNGRHQVDKLLSAFFGDNKSGMKISDYLPLLTNKPVIFSIKHTSAKSKNDEDQIDTFANVRGLKPLKDEEEAAA
jgi:hypothetical protein